MRRCMPNLPDIECPNCHRSFPLRMSGAAGSVFQFENCIYYCPHCRFPVPLEGTYVATEQAFTRILSARPSLDELERLVGALTSQRARTDPAAAQEEAEAEAPRLAPMLNDFFGLPLEKWRDVLGPLVLVLGCLIGFVKDPGWEGATKVTGAFIAAAIAALKKERAPVNIEEAARRGAEIAAEQRTRLRRERNKRKREKKRSRRGR